MFLHSGFAPESVSIIWLDRQVGSCRLEPRAAKARSTPSGFSRGFPDGEVLFHPSGDEVLWACRFLSPAHRDTMETMTTAALSEQTEAAPLEVEQPVDDKPWQTIVWNDPVNLMSYVTYVFQKLFGYSRDHATQLMLDVHHKGKALVSSGSKEKVEGDVAKLQAAGLWATMEQQS
jgi:ATP-dependent Clp protease adaptor protein ClpS